MATGCRASGAIGGDFVRRMNVYPSKGVPVHRARAREDVAVGTRGDEERAWWRPRAALVAVLLASALTGITPSAPALTSFPFTIIDAPNAGPKGTQVESINDAGQMVGAFTDASDKIHGFLRTRNGAFVTIDIPGATSTYAAGISDAGRIVGGFDDGGGKSHAFLRAATGALTTFDVPGAIVTQPSGINTTG